MDKYMKTPLFLVLLFWILSAVSGCLAPGEGGYSHISVEEIKVSPLYEEYPTAARGETGIVLNVTASIVNEGKEDSSALLIHFDLNEAYSTRELATKNVELDYIKGRTMINQSTQMTVPGPGSYDVEVSLSEEGKDPSPIAGTRFLVGEKGEVEKLF